MCDTNLSQKELKRAVISKLVINIIEIFIIRVEIVGIVHVEIVVVSFDLVYSRVFVLGRSLEQFNLDDLF